MEHSDRVTSDIWLYDVMDLQTPIETADDETVEAYYKNDNALFTIDVEDGMEIKVIEAIYEIIGEDNALTGEAVDTAVAQEATGSRSEEHTSELQSRGHLVCRLLLEKKKEK